jgi:hypothetical protein
MSKNCFHNPKDHTDTIEPSPDIRRDLDRNPFANIPLERTTTQEKGISLSVSCRSSLYELYLSLIYIARIYSNGRLGEKDSCGT